MSVNKPILPDDLQAFVDGQLEDDRRRLVEAYVEETPEAASTVADWSRQRDMMQALYGKIASEEVPRRLDPRRLIERRPEPLLRWRSLAASLAFLAIGGAVGWGAAVYGPGAGLEVDPLVTTAVEAHHLYAEDMVRPVELRADEAPLLQKWLARRLDRAIRLPDLQAFDLRLVGGRLLPNGDGAAAQIMYEDGAGQRVTLYVAPSGTDTETSFAHAKVERLEAVFWSDDAIRCAVIGSLPHDRLQAIAKAAYGQLI